MLPVVAHVVAVIEGSDPALDETGERGAAAAVDLMPPTGIVGVRHAVGLVVGGELPQVIILPAHGGLYDPVQGLQIGRGRHRDAAPDQWLDINQFDTQDGNVIGAHAASLADWRRQFHGNNLPSRLTGMAAARQATRSRNQMCFGEALLIGSLARHKLVVLTALSQDAAADWAALAG